MKPGWVWHRFRERTGRSPMARMVLPSVQPSEPEKMEAFRTLARIGAGAGYPANWAGRTFAECFGYDPGNAW